MISFKLFAGTDVGLRDNNEDNFTVCPDISKDEWIVPANQQEPILLSPSGCVMVVADGMGGMNAGEVASDIAIKTVEQMFSPSKMPAGAINNSDAIKAYLKKVIVSADLNVKKRCEEDSSTEGMGSTIVIAWLIDGNVFIGWMGDSRAYSFIPDKGIARLSKDHSYVQELVDAKMLTEEEAMIHPQSNVIMRSLGDVTQKAKPDVICHPVSKDEIILLCSDGLCGVCTDTAIAEIVQKESADLRACKEVLTNAALEADGSDNITISLLQIVEVDKSTNNNENKTFVYLTWQNILLFVFSLSLVAALVYAGIQSCDISKPQKKDTISDSIKVVGTKNESKNSVTIGSVKENNTSSTKDNKNRETLQEKIQKSQEAQKVVDPITPTPAEGEGNSSPTPMNKDSIN